MPYYRRYYNRYRFKRYYHCPCGTTWEEEFEISWVEPDEKGPTAEYLAQCAAIRSTCPQCHNIVPPPCCPTCKAFLAIEKREWIGSSVDDTAYEQEEIFVICPNGHEFLVAERYDSER